MQIFAGTGTFALLSGYSAGRSRPIYRISPLSDCKVSAVVLHCTTDRVLTRYCAPRRAAGSVRQCGAAERMGVFGTALSGTHAVHRTAGAYVSGAAGSNTCPAGSVRIETVAACRTAAAAAGKTAASVSVVTDPDYPRGCYYPTGSNTAFFNAHAVGAGCSARQLLCAALTTGAPLTRRRADARVLRGARGRWV